MNENKINFQCDYLNNFSFRLKKIRLHRKLTQEQLSESTGLTVNFLAKLESNSTKTKKLPSINSLIKLSEALEISPSYFFIKDVLECDELRLIIDAHG